MSAVSLTTVQSVKLFCWWRQSILMHRGVIQVSDLLDMTVFPVNPLTDFCVDLAHLWDL
jgi:hypothetical protein